MKPRRLICASVAAIALAAAAPAAARAAALAPSSFNFGTHSVGSISEPQYFTLTATCTDVVMGVCTTPDTTATYPRSVTGDFQFLATNCPAVWTGSVPFLETTCLVFATFSPNNVGPHHGALTIGPYSTSLNGTAYILTGPKRKCKKKAKRRAGSAAKRCKRKKKSEK